MKRFFLSSLLLTLSVALAAQVFYYDTVLESGERISSTWTIEKTQSGFILFLDNEEGSQKIECLSDGDVIAMTGWDLDGRKVLDIRADSRFIHVELPDKNGNWVSKDLDRDPEIPFFQPMGLCMQEFVLGKIQEQDFYVLDLDALKLRKMVVAKKGSGTRELMGKQQKVIQTEIRFTGLLKNFWKGECDFFSDGRWVYFSGKVDISSPPAEIVLIRIEE